jgi:glutamyl-tRNA synthetase
MFASIDAAIAATGRQPAVRFRIPDDASAIVSWNDLFHGAQCIDARALGDFVIAKGDGTAAYQLAVVMDDAAAGVTRVIRGDDLMDSTPRQVLLYRAMGLGQQAPGYCHLPLVVGSDGRRLAKRHGDTRLSYYRSLGIPSQRILALLARWCGIDPAGRCMTIGQVMEELTLEKLPRQAIVFSADDDARLKA